jgi:hypothetical protein
MSMAWPLGTKPDEVLLCPVPAVHLVDAEAIAAREGYVAFGTSATTLFLDLQAKGWIGQIQVFIFPSMTGAEHAQDPKAVRRLLDKPWSCPIAWCRSAMILGRLGCRVRLAQPRA